MDEKKKNRIASKIVPPGISGLMEIGISIILLLLLFLYSRLFYTNLGAAERAYKDYLFSFSRRKGVIYGVARPFSTDINTCIKGCFAVFPMVMVWCFMIGFLNYATFHKPTKSIYLMKRLRNRSELHIRCLTVPVACALIAIIMLVILLAIYVHEFQTAPLGEFRSCKISVWGLFYN
ncbi:MAG: hypothetical protein IKW95_06355 [Lachnospiraceae bacterium]|nr:hypothetical protein [Lachnospiraceae bacterium]